MKITDPDVIKTGEKDLIEAVKDDLDPDTVMEVLKDKMKASSLVSDGGQIVVHNNEIAFRIDFNIQLSGSLMFDRQGNYIPASDEPEHMEDVLSEDLDLDDLDIDETLGEVAHPVSSEPDEPEAQMLREKDKVQEDEDELIDGDIDDILKESREFWEQKDDS